MPDGDDNEIIPNNKIIKIFVSMPFDKSLDRLYMDGIEGSSRYIDDYYLRFIRADKDRWKHNNLEENVLKHIDESDILIADISSYHNSVQANANVMHEIGYANGRNTSIILIDRKGESKKPANLRGRLLVKYDDVNDDAYNRFSKELSRKIRDTIANDDLPRIKPEFSVDGFFARNHVHLDRLIEKASSRVWILTTNLTYTLNHLSDSISSAIVQNKGNPDFKVEILTMDPESSVANERAVQLGKAPRRYRDDLRQSHENMLKKFEKKR